MLPATHKALKLPEFRHPALAPYQAALQRLAKPAWLLRCRQGKSVSRLTTHMGGTTPFVPRALGWPLCQDCGKPFEFVLQVDFAEFAGSTMTYDSGLFQFFCCWNCCLAPKGVCSTHCRWFPDFSKLKKTAINQARCPYAGKSWKVLRDYPDNYKPYRIERIPFLSVPAKFSRENPISARTLNKMVHNGNEQMRLWAVYSFTQGLYLEDQMISRIGGYPPWMQFDDETPDCTECGKRTEFIAAIGTEDNKYMWGDSGYWYIFACKATRRCRGLQEPIMRSQCY
jgi:uncharacterized protein YwqG